MEENTKYVKLSFYFLQKVFFDSEISKLNKLASYTVLHIRYTIMESRKFFSESDEDDLRTCRSHIIMKIKI